MLTSYPLWRVFVAYVFGIILSIYVECPFHTSAFFVLLSFIALAFVSNWWIKALGLMLFFMMLGWWSTTSYLSLKPLPEGVHHYKLKVLKVDQQKSSMEVQLMGVAKIPVKVASQKLRLVKVEEVEKNSPGDLLYVQATAKKISTSKNPSSFDYPFFMSLKGVHYILTDVKILQKERRDSWQTHLHHLRQRLLSSIERWPLAKQQQEVLKALLLGHKSGLDSDLKIKFSQVGVMHVLAVSGLHVGLVYMLLSFVFGKWKKKMWYTFLVIISIWFYALLTGLSESVVRASIMFTMIHLTGRFQRRTNIYYTLMASAFLTLLIHPYALFSVGFQLSYAAVLAIVSFQPVLFGWFKCSRLLRPLWSLTTVSIAAQLGTLPLTLYYFHGWPTYFLLGNWLAIPLVWLIMVMGLPLLVMSSFSPIPELMTGLLKWPLEFLIVGTQFIHRLPGGFVGDVWIDKLQLIFMVLSIIFLYYLLKGRSAYILHVVATMAVLFMWWSAKDFMHTKRKGVQVYSASSGMLIDFIRGNSVHTIRRGVGKGSWLNKCRIDHLAKLGVCTDTTIHNLEEHFSANGFHQQKNMIQFEDQRWAIYRESSDSLEIKLWNPDYVYVLQGKPFRTKAQVILSANLEGTIKEAWHSKNNGAIDLAEGAIWVD